MANYIFKESIPKIAEFFYLFFIFYLFLPFLLNLLWDMNEDFHFEVPKLNISSCIQFVHNNKDFVWFLGEDQAKRTRTQENSHIYIYISVIPPPKFLSVSFCSIFILYVVSLFLKKKKIYFINFYLCLSQYRRTKIKKILGDQTLLTTGVQWGLKKNGMIYSNIWLQLKK